MGMTLTSATSAQRTELGTLGPKTVRIRWSVWAVALISSVSGFCSLLYQVIWERTVRYNFGGDSISSAIVTATFLLGLGLGAYIFGRSRREAFRSYALVELSIGLFALVSFNLISSVSDILAKLLQTRPEGMEGLRPAVIIGCILLLLPPCTLIGGTLPLMFRCFIVSSEGLGRKIGLIYGLNTLGAALGILAAPFVFMNNLTLPQVLTFAGCTNIFLSLLIWQQRPNGARRITAPEQYDSPRVISEDFGGTILGIAFFSGFIAISLEVLLFRALPIVNPSSAYNFPAVLAPFLLALALGSIVFTRGLPESNEAILRRIGGLMMGSAVAMLVRIWASAYLRFRGYPVSFLPILEGSFDHRTIFFVIVFAAVLVMPVPLCNGAIFPLLVRLRASGNDLSQATGKIYLVNSIGSFAGAMLANFIGLPFLGTKAYLTLLYAISCIGGIFIASNFRLQPKYQSRRAILATALLAAGVRGFPPFQNAVRSMADVHLWC